MTLEVKDMNCYHFRKHPFRNGHFVGVDVLHYLNEDHASPPSETAGGDGTLVESSTPPTTSKKTWIAGAVASPIALVVLVAAVFLFRRRLRAKKPDPDDAGDRGGWGLGLGSQGTKDGASTS
jgi:hypothetical protein